MVNSPCSWNDGDEGKRWNYTNLWRKICSENKLGAWWYAILSWTYNDPVTYVELPDSTTSKLWLMAYFSISSAWLCDKTLDKIRRYLWISTGLQ